MPSRTVLTCWQKTSRVVCSSSRCRSFAYGWMENMSADEIENYKKDEHAANCLRVNGNVYLMDEFYRLFNCQDGKMYLAPKDRIEIW